MKIYLATILILFGFSVNSQELKGIRIGDYCADCKGGKITPSKYTTVAGVSGSLMYSSISSGGIYKISFRSDSPPKKMFKEEEDVTLPKEKSSLPDPKSFQTQEHRDYRDRESNQASRRKGINLSSAERMKKDIEDYYGIKLIQKERNSREWESIVGNTIYRFYLNQLEVKQLRFDDIPTYYLYQAHFVITDKLLMGIYWEDKNKQREKLAQEKRIKKAQEKTKRKSDF